MDLGVFIMATKSSATSSLTATRISSRGEAGLQSTRIRSPQFRFYDVAAILEALFGDRYAGKVFHSLILSRKVAASDTGSYGGVQVLSSGGHSHRRGGRSSALQLAWPCNGG